MAYSSKLKSEQTDGFFEAILSLETMEECYRFFEDICTIKEIQAIAQRLEVAKQLKENKTYNEIEVATGAQQQQSQESTDHLTMVLTVIS